MNILNLTLNRKWFDMIASGEKKEEYRDIKPYWIRRLVSKNFSWDCISIEKINVHLSACPNGFFKSFDITSANNGYAKNCPNVKWQHKGIRIGTGRPEWGAEPGKQYFVLEIGELILPSHTEQIVCPECETEQTAIVVHSVPWWTYVHRCVKCQHIIMESEWNKLIIQTNQS